MRKTTKYNLGNQLESQRYLIDELITNKLNEYSQYSKSIMTDSINLYKSGGHYGVISPRDFK